MTAINFPANPSNGDTHQGFVYNSTLGVWQSAGSQTAVTSFTGLSDTPSTLGTAGQIAKVNSGGTALEFADQSGVTVYATIDLLPGTANAGDMAFVTATNRLYIWNGSGWYNIALINTNPTISGVSSSYALATDGTATTVTITATDPEGVPITYSIASDTSGNIATVSQGTGSNSNVFTITPSTNNANGGSFILTFRASDGVNIASSVSTFTLTFSIVNSKYTTALITSVGANNAVNNSFTDSSGNSHAITSVGAASQGTFSPFRQNGYSWYFDGTGDYLSAADDATFELGSGDFTIETWIYLTGYSNSYGGYYASGICGKDNTSTRSYTFSISGTSNTHTGLYFNMFVGGSPNTTQSTTSFNLNQWYHVAVSRESGTLRMFVDGVIVQTNTSANQTPTEGSQPFVIGAGSSYSGYEYRFPGYLTDFRFVKGTAVYTAAFTPPTERLTAVTNTSLLLGNLPYLADGSTNNHKLTSNGDVSMQPFTPYDNAGTYTAADHDAGISFNGTDAYVRSDTAVDAFTTAGTDWTIEAWVYPRDLGGVNAAADYWVSANRASDGLYVFAMGPKQLAYDNNNESGLTDMAVNQWHHVAAVNSGGYMGLKYYINGYHVNSYNPSGSAPALDVARFTLGAATQGSTGTIANQFNGIVSNVRVSDTDLYTNSDYLPTNPPTQTFTPPTAPFTTNSNTDFLLYGRDAAIIDKSQTTKSLTLNGSAQASTTYTKYNTSSVYTNGGSVTISDNKENSITGDDFTVEWWAYPTATPAASKTLATDGWSAGGYGAWMIYSTASGYVLYSSTTGGSWDLFSAYDIGWSLWSGSWKHCAFTRQGNVWRFFLDGTLTASVTPAGEPADLVDNTGGITIGDANSLNRTHPAIYFEDFRITKGLARYTANFTPPTAALQG